MFFLIIFVNFWMFVGIGIYVWKGILIIGFLIDFFNFLNLFKNIVVCGLIRNKLKLLFLIILLFFVVEIVFMSIFFFFCLNKFVVFEVIIDDDIFVV